MSADVLRFGSFELDSENFELRRKGRPVKLDRTPLELLILLASQPGNLVTHREAVDQVWGKEVFIEAESALYTAVRKIRLALGDDPARPKFVQTVPRKGYRFIAPLTTHRAPRTKADRAAKRAMLAVLPLENLSGDPRQEYFSDGLTEELITALGRLSPQELGVIARTSVMRYKGTRKNISEIARELGADYLIEGSVRRERKRVRIAIQLIRAADQTHVWAENFERPLGDVLHVQSEVAEAAVQNIRLKLVPALPVPSPVDPDVYDSYLRARYLWDQRTTPAIRAAIGYFEKALQRDSGYAPAWAGLGNCFAALALTSNARPRECFPQAGEAAARALALDASLSEAHIARGLVYFWFDWDWLAAEKEFRCAVELHPSNSSARMFLAHLHSNLQRHDEAVPEIRAARRLDPLSLIVNTHEGQFLYNARRYNEASAPLERVLELAPRFWLAHLVLGKLCGVRQRFREALAEFAKAYRYSYGNLEPAGLRGYTLGMSGRAASARRVLRELERHARRRYVPPLIRSLIWLGLAEHTAALEALENAAEERDVRLTFLAVEPRWDPLRTHPQFERLCRRVGLPRGQAGHC
jgi:TolB-like protein/Flp pilus assembly protein TadD